MPLQPGLRNLNQDGDSRHGLCRDLNAAERLTMGATKEWVRLSVGIEDPADSLSDRDLPLRIHSVAVRNNLVWVKTAGVM